MKHSYTRYAGGGIGLFLILCGLIWTCQKIASPGRLSASDSQRPVELTDSREPEISFSPATMRLSAARSAKPAVSHAKPVSASRVNPASTPEAVQPKPLPLTDESVGRSSTILSESESADGSGAEPFRLENMPSAAPKVPAGANQLSLTDVTEPTPGITLPAPAPAAASASGNSTPILSEPFPLSDRPEPVQPSETPLSAEPNAVLPGVEDRLLENPEEAESPLPTQLPGALPTLPETPLPMAISPPSSAPSATEPTIESSEPEKLATRAEPFSVPAMVSAYTPTGRPGDAALEGPQKAELTLSKQLPDEIQVGREDVFKVILKNTGAGTAKNVVLRDLVPNGTKLVSTAPRVEPTADGELVWTNFDLAPNEERVFEYRLVPEKEGEIGSVASVSFNAEVSGRTRCTRPLLKLAVEAPDAALIGEKVRFDIQITNPGTGVAEKVTLREEVPDQLRHSGGKTLDNAIGSIAPGETKKLTLTLDATGAGMAANRMVVTAEGGLSEEVLNEITVNAPELALEIAGAKVRYLEREAVYTLKVWNPGTAPAREVKLTAELPPQMKFVRTNNEGVYQESTHTVHWELIELPNNVAPGDIELVVMPSEAGTGKLTFRGEGAMNLAANSTHEIQVDGMPALSYAVASLSDPVEVGRDAIYEIRLSNRGTKESTNVNIAVSLPEAMEVVASDGPTRYAPGAGGVVFAPLGRVGAKEEVVYQLTTRCSAPGDHRIKVQVGSDDMEPLVKEESVRVYGAN